MRIAFRCTVASLFLVAAACAQAQTNDDWSNRILISTLPYELNTPMSGATNAASDPLPGCQTTNQSSYGTVWFSYTTGAADEFLTMRAKDAQIGALIAVYTGGPGTFHIVSGACAVSGSVANNAQLAGVRLAANTEYSILLSALSPTTGLSSDFAVTTATLYHVTKLTDSFRGSCAVGDCSLREAVQAANLAAGAVILPAGTYVLSLAGTNEVNNATGDLNISNDMGIYGAGMNQTIIDANSIDRVLSVTPSGTDTVTLILGDLTLTHGNATDGATQVGGAINNQPLAPGFIGLERVALVANHALLNGGGLDTATAGTVRESRFTQNSLDANVGNGGGGAQIFNQEDRPFEIESSTFDNNDGGHAGGAIQQGGGNLRITNSTISGNNTNQNGGGIHVGGGHFEMSSTTVAFNNAGNPGNNSGGGLFLNGPYAYVLYNNLIAGNTDGDCLIFTFTGGAINSNHNLVQDPRGCTFAGTGDITGTDPLLDPTLADNGGPTPTLAIAFKSPARNAGDPAGCNAPGGLPLVYDQRGADYSRVVGPACDMGAWEHQTLFMNGFEP
jgi:CSLREA domain-containing protein